MPVIPQPEILSSGAYSPITVWTTTAPFHSPLASGLSPLSGYPSSLGRVSPPPPSDTSSKDHSGSESPISDEEERLQSKLSDPHAIEAEKFQCNLCNKTYSTFSGLAKHKQLHCDAQSRKSFSCKYCDKEYVSLGALKMHIRTHTLPCVCKICGKAFSRPWLLQGHIRTHTGEKPFSCPHCNRAFADRSNLRAHLQTHSDVKKYQCKNCSKTFSRMSLLHKHEESGCCVAHWVTQSMFTRTECISSLRRQMTNKSPKAFSLVLTDQIICIDTHTHACLHACTHAHTPHTHNTRSCKSTESMCLKLILSMWSSKLPYIYWQLDWKDKRQGPFSSKMKRKAHCIFPYQERMQRFYNAAKSFQLKEQYCFVIEFVIEFPIGREFARCYLRCLIKYSKFTSIHVWCLVAIVELKPFLDDL